MEISILKTHNFLKHNSLHLLWPRTVNNAGLRSRRFPDFHFLLLSHRLQVLSHSLSSPNCYHLSLPPFPPLPRRMSSMSFSQETDNPIPLDAKTVRVVIKGRVQGVFYRNWTVDNAKELGLKGWVRNHRDGSVEALFSGSPEKVQEMEGRCRRGPPMLRSRVSRSSLALMIPEPRSSVSQPCDVWITVFCVYGCDRAW